MIARALLLLLLASPAFAITNGEGNISSKTGTGNISTKTGTGNISTVFTAALSGNTTYFYDTFTEGSDTTNIAAHTMDVGPGWTGTDSNSGHLKIFSGAGNLGAADASSFYGMHINGTPSSANYCAEWDFDTGADITSDGNVTFRWDNGTSTGYYAGADSSGKWYFFRDDPGDVLLASGTLSALLGSFTNTSQYHARLCGHGSNIYYEINGVTAKNTTDATYSAAASVGLGMSLTSYKFDNFKVLSNP